MSSTFSLARLAAVVIAVAVLALPLYVFAIRDTGSSVQGISAPQLLTAPPAEGLSTATGVSEGMVAQDFEISTQNGERIRLSDLRGRAVVINFWATWCGSCLSEMPEIKALQEERGIEAFTVLAINSGETLDRAMRFIDFLEAPFVYGLDLDLRVSDAYGVYGLPLSVFIDADGVIRSVYRGHANRERLAEFTDAAISARPPGEFPLALRMISTIPRDRLLTIVSEGAGRIEVRSRSLRCDPSYCGEDAVVTVKTRPGVETVDLDLAAQPEPALVVEFDSRVVSSQMVIEDLVQALNGLSDPLYTRELEIVYLEAAP